MNLRLAERLRCPLCRSALELRPLRASKRTASAQELEELSRRGGEREQIECTVESGVLLCEMCGVWYPVHEHVPVMLDFETPLHRWFREEHASSEPALARFAPPRAEPRPGELDTQRSFSTQWADLGADELTFSYTHADREDFLRIELDWPDWVLQRPDSRVLDVGCGYGLEASFLRNVTRAEVFGTDLNLSLLRSGARFRELPFVHTAIASLFALPFAEACFDVVYSHGVLHHTHSTRRALDGLLRYVAPGGMVYIWVYALEDMSLSTGLRVGYTIECAVRPRIARLPTPLQSALVNLLALPHYRRMRRGGANRQLWKFKNSVHSMRDRWTCRYAHRHSLHEVLCWFLERGFDYRLVDSLAYRRRFGFPLIGIGVRATPQAGAGSASSS